MAFFFVDFVIVYIFFFPIFHMSVYIHNTCQVQVHIVIGKDKKKYMDYQCMMNCLVKI
jgi:hypothetical protein